MSNKNNNTNYYYKYDVFFCRSVDYHQTTEAKINDITNSQLDYVEDFLVNGTSHKIHDDYLLQYHEAACPLKIAIRFDVEKTNYMLFLWFEDFKIRAAFENFYREYPEAQMDFLFRIDPEKNIYQILFTCKEAEQPLPLNEEAYQMIVFKSKFERYRTQNYNQPRGAWIW